MLIKLYIKDPDPLIAEVVAKHVAAILAHPKYIDGIEQRCRLRKTGDSLALFSLDRQRITIS